MIPSCQHTGARGQDVDALEKGLEVLPQGLDYALLTTDLAAKTCSENQKLPKGAPAARDPIHPWSGALQACVKSWNIYLAWSSLALKPIIR